VETRNLIEVVRPLASGNTLRRFSLRPLAEGVARFFIFGISSGPLPTAESPMQPIQPEAPLEPDVPRLKPTVYIKPLADRECPFVPPSFDELVEPNCTDHRVTTHQMRRP